MIKWFLIGAATGVAVGVALHHPRSRALLKRAIKSGLDLFDSVAERYEVLKEDVADLVAEAQHERGESGQHDPEKVGVAA